MAPGLRTAEGDCALTTPSSLSKGASNWLTPACGALLILATLVLYYPLRQYGFVCYDDIVYVTENPNIRTGLTWRTVKTAFAFNLPAANWHPLTWLSHALDYQLFLLEPAGHHEVNVLLHALNALLLFRVLCRATGCRGRSLVVAALLAVHPVNVESVAWISERKNLLSMLFFLLALGAYRWYAQRPRLGRYALVALLYALGLMSKPQVVTFPFVLLLWDYWPLQRVLSGISQPSPAAGETIPRQKLSWLVLEKVPLFVLSAASAAITMKAQRLGRTLTWLPFSSRLANATVSYVRYLGKALWPTRLAVFYPHTYLSMWKVCGSLLLLVAITIIVCARWRTRYLLVGWLWFLGTLVPMIGLVQVGQQAMADRYAYLSFIGLFIVICWSVADWAERQQVPRAPLAAATLAVLLALAVVTHDQATYWADSVTLWSHTLRVTGPNVVAENNLGMVLLGENKNEEAMSHFYNANATDPSDAVSLLNIGAYEQGHGDPAQAIEHFRKVVGTPGVPVLVWAMALNNLCYAYRDHGDALLAQKCFAARPLKLSSPSFLQASLP